MPRLCCPRCGGPLMRDMEYDGPVIVCLHCGHVPGRSAAVEAVPVCEICGITIPSQRQGVRVTDSGRVVCKTPGPCLERARGRAS